jgi:hypothetical protein
MAPQSPGVSFSNSSPTCYSKPWNCGSRYSSCMGTNEQLVKFTNWWNNVLKKITALMKLVRCNGATTLKAVLQCLKMLNTDVVYTEPSRSHGFTNCPR